MTKLAAHVPKKDLQSIGECALQIINVLHSENLINTDVSARNFIARKDGKGRFEPLMIDFGMCKFREDADNDTGWWN